MSNKVELGFFGVIVVAAIRLVALYSLYSVAIMILWNLIAPQFNAPIIGFWTALAIRLIGEAATYTSKSSD